MTADGLPRPLAHVAAIATRYLAGEGRLQGVERSIRLAANEGALGPSPKAIAAMQAAASEMHRYPDGAALSLREKLAAANGLDPARILPGAGSDELLSLLLRAYAGPGDEIIHTVHGFAMYAIYARHTGAVPVAAPESDRTADVDAILAAVSPRTRIVFLANPNNPTGTWLSGAEVRRLRAGLRGDILLVLDAAYLEFVDAPDYESPYALADHPAVVITRTFSKAYGLGGARLGWLYAPAAIIETLSRIRDPFNVNVMALVAGEAALEDRAFLDRGVAHTLQERARAMAVFNELGLTAAPSQGNFILADCGSAERAESLRLAYRSQGILVRHLPGYGLPTALRITIGTADEMQAVYAATRAFVAAQA